jgi:hypothetical protein
MARRLGDAGTASLAFRNEGELALGRSRVAGPD